MVFSTKKKKKKKKNKETNSAMQGHVGLQWFYAKLEMGLVYGDCEYFFKSKWGYCSLWIEC